MAAAVPRFLFGVRTPAATFVRRDGDNAIGHRIMGFLLTLDWVPFTLEECRDVAR